MTEQVLDCDLQLNSAAAPPEIPQRAWQAGDLLIDLELRRLQRAGVRVNLQERPLRLLCMLLQRGGRPWSRRELHQALWPRCDWDSGERSLNTAIRKLRRAIGDAATEPKLIETLRASGYRWVGPTPRALTLLPHTHEAEQSTAQREPAAEVAVRRHGWSALASSLLSMLLIAAACIAWQRIDAVPFGRERLLVEVAARLPAKAASIALPAAAQQSFAEAGTLLASASTTEPIERALALLEGVLSVAPEHSGALRTYARAQNVRAMYARDPSTAQEHRLIAHAALRRALHADPGSSAVAADIAKHLYWSEWDSANSAEWFALARREAPQDADILRSYAWYALADNHVTQALEAMHSALALAPLNVALHSDLGWFYFRTGHYADALRQCRVALQMAANDASAQVCEERALAELGRFDEAWQALRRHSPGWLDSRDAERFGALDARRAYAAAMHVAAQKTREREGPGFDSACLEAIAGNRDAAEADLRAAIALADPRLHLARVSPELVRLLGAAATERLAGETSRPGGPTSPTDGLLEQGG
jgi:DNA-binding winged helix-turn-helix (wHTH) protein/Flp pilus assembly protein TadD